MKKFLFLLVSAFIVCTSNVFATNSKDGAYKYIVTISTEKVYIYYEGGREVGREIKQGQTYTITEWADNPEQAKNQAKDRCSSMCRTYTEEKEGNQWYNGKLLECRSFTRIYDASATVAPSTAI